MSLGKGYLHDYLVASFIALSFGLAASTAAGGLVGNWGPYIGALFVIGIFGWIPSGLAAGYINFKFHQVSENKAMAGLGAGFFAALVFAIVELMTTIVFVIAETGQAATHFIAWILQIVFAFIFIPIGGYLIGVLEGRPFAMPEFFNFSRLHRELPPPPTQSAQTCPTCGRPMTFVQQYNRWYCDNCKKYS